MTRPLAAWVNRLFRMEEMTGDGLCPVYLRRWTLFGWGRGEPCRFRIYLHHFLSDDWGRDPHDHPKRFISIGLKGEYWEDVFESRGDLNPGRYMRTDHYSAPWIRTFRPAHAHRLRIHPRGDERPSRPRPNAWTICIVLKTQREWGFFYLNRFWLRWDDYLDSGYGRERKDC